MTSLWPVGSYQRTLFLHDTFYEFSFYRFFTSVARVSLHVFVSLCLESVQFFPPSFQNGAKAHYSRNVSRMMKISSMQSIWDSDVFRLPRSDGCRHFKIISLSSLVTNDLNSVGHYITLHFWRELEKKAISPSTFWHKIESEMCCSSVKIHSFQNHVDALSFCSFCGKIVLDVNVVRTWKLFHFIIHDWNYQQHKKLNWISWLSLQTLLR